MEHNANCYVLVMRHGERIDNSLTESKHQQLKEYDPELTNKGLEQAKNIGEQLQCIITCALKSIKVYSSPFTRTLQTGHKVAKAFKDSEVVFHIHEGLSELLGQNNFKYNPLSTLLYYNINNNQYKNFLSFLNPNQCNYSKYNLVYPETFEKGIERYRNTAKEIASLIEKGNEDLSIIVTHGYGVSSISTCLFNLDETFIDYCTSFLFQCKHNRFDYLEELNPLVL